VLYSSKSQCWKIADFGFTCPGSSSLAYSNSTRGTDAYRAPELLRGGSRFSRKSDIWALGCILYEMCMRRKAFRGDWEISDWLTGSAEPNISIPSYRSPDGRCARCSNLHGELSLKPNDLEDINVILRALLSIDTSIRPAARDLKLTLQLWERQES